MVVILSGGAAEVEESLHINITARLGGFLLPPLRHPTRYAKNKIEYLFDFGVAFWRGVWYNHPIIEHLFYISTLTGVKWMYEEVYEQNKGLLVMMAKRYARVCALDRAVSMEDLIQAGCIGLMKAADSFDPNAGKSWSGWACWHIQMEFNSALGLRQGHFTRPHTGAVALDGPLRTGDGEGVTAGDLLADETLPDADEAILRDELCRDVREAVARLKSEGQRQVVELCKLRGFSYRQAAERLGVSVGQAYQLFFRATNNLARDPSLRALAGLGERGKTSARRGSKAFRRGWGS